MWWTYLVKQAHCWMREHPWQWLCWLLLFWATVSVMIISGCTTTPQPVACVCPPQSKQWQFVWCMTGPYGWMQPENSHFCQWANGKPVNGWPYTQRWGRAVFPTSCRGFDTDGDNDVDLRDFQEVQNER